jgi:uncharacterized protein
VSRGFLAGAGWGTVVAGVGLVVASQVTDLRPVKPAQAPETVGVAVAPVTDKMAPPMLATTDIAPPTGIATTEPQPQVPEPVEQTEVPATTPLMEPDTQDAGPEDAEAEITAPQAQTEIASPDVPAPAETAPEAPVPPTAASTGLTQGASDLPQAVVSDTAPVALPDPVLAPMPDAMAIPEALPEPILAPEPAIPAETPFVVDPNLNVIPPQPPVPDVAMEPEATPARPAPGFQSAVNGVTTGRLPAIGRGTDPAPSQAAATADIGNLAPIEQFARPFSNTSSKPLFAILLQDTGGPDVDREALAAIPFPVTFVIDPALPDAATAAAIYRAAGQEVVMLASGLPAGANASDIATSFEAMARVLPEAVGVVDKEQGGFQGNRTLATQVLAVIKDQGRGVISWDRGLNAASQVAQRDGLSHVAIFRPLDGNEENSPLIRRYLDRAAFKAAQDGRVVVAGHTRPETVTAVLEWAVEGRAATVAIAPVTAVMSRQ